MTQFNYFTEINITFRKQLVQFKDKIMQLKLIKMQNGQRKPIQQLCFLHFDVNQKASIQMNQIFWFLFGKERTISTQLYKQYYAKIISRTYQLTSKIYIKIKECLAQIGKFKTFGEFQAKLKREEGYNNGYQKLTKIYSFLKKNLPEAILLTDTRSLQFHDYNQNYILTNSLEFKRVTQVKIKKDIPAGFEELANLINMKYQDRLVNDNFVKLIQTSSEGQKYTIQVMMNQFKDHFKVDQVNGLMTYSKYTPQTLVSLGCFISTFDLLKDTVNFAKQFKQLSTIEPFNITKKNFKKMEPTAQFLFQTKFKQQFLTFIQKKIQAVKGFMEFVNANMVTKQNPYKCFNHILSIDNDKSFVEDQAYNINEKTNKLVINLCMDIQLLFNQLQI